MSDNTPALPSVERVKQTVFLAITWTATWVSFTLVIFRLATRAKSSRTLLVEDYLVILAWLLLLVSAVLWQIKSSVLYWMYDIQSGKVAPTLEFPIEYSAFLRLVVAWNTFFYSSLWAVKFSFLFFFRRLGSNVSVGRIWWWVVTTVTLAGLIASIADIDYKCTVNNLAYIMEKCSLVKGVRFDDNTFYGNMAIDIATDLLILSIPFRILWNVQIPLKKKAILLGIFSLTIIIIITSILRVVLVKGVGSATRVSSIDWLYLWSNVEVGIAISVACLASFRQLFVFKQAHGKGSQATRGSLRSFLRNYHFKKLLSRSTSHEGSKQNWTYPLEHSAANDSQHHIVPLQSVHVNRSVDITMDMATPELDSRMYAQNRGFSFG
ncbi:hypothetical protein F5B22DRAFT_648004 [Xylaria bambusicola]|uniref:uncharacterized protein n=1 Tax=Xylaria bambusicola TaxID=326684 RepID=UPI0020085BD4|nr:uncharacterized protein F5B22DRAFT_648004 [Xylaria bambusicola]KAI0513193.1 hypothetical protein F5B22DRAFT_648004 [Xylaria bambusicola]